MGTAKEETQKLMKVISIPDYFSKYLGFSPNYLIENEKVHCIMHNDDTPSLKYDEENDTFNCFGCSKGGNVVNLHMQLNAEKFTIGTNKFGEPILSYNNALKDLGKLEGVEINLTTWGKDNSFIIKNSVIEQHKYKRILPRNIYLYCMEHGINLSEGEKLIGKKVKSIEE